MGKYKNPQLIMEIPINEKNHKAEERYFPLVILKIPPGSIILFRSIQFLDSFWFFPFSDKSGIIVIYFNNSSDFYSKNFINTDEITPRLAQIDHQKISAAGNKYQEREKVC